MLPVMSMSLPLATIFEIKRRVPVLWKARRTGAPQSNKHVSSLTQEQVDGLFSPHYLF